MTGHRVGRCPAGRGVTAEFRDEALAGSRWSGPRLFLSFPRALASHVDWSRRYIMSRTRDEALDSYITDMLALEDHLDKASGARSPISRTSTLRWFPTSR